MNSESIIVLAFIVWGLVFTPTFIYFERKKDNKK